ncbi:MAG TPA: hypothetical protein VIF64_11620 [Pyrinomonadaceae bacterium]
MSFRLVGKCGGSIDPAVYENAGHNITTVPMSQWRQGPTYFVFGEKIEVKGQL